MRRFSSGLPKHLFQSPLAAVLAGLAALWGILFWALPPSRQNFPLNDDWAYSRGAFAFARGQGLHYFGQPSMPLLGQWLWAAPFIRVLGESHPVLRLSTIVLSFLGLAAFHDLLRRQIGASPAQAAFAAAALGLNPLVFLSSGTYLSDVPALSFSLIALALYGRALGSGRGSVLAAASGVALLGTVTRQNAVAAALAAGLLAWRDPRRRWHPAWVLAVLLPVATGFVVNVWLGTRADAVPLHPKIPSPEKVVFLSFVALHSMGLAVLPLLALKPKPCSWPVFALSLQVMLAAAVFVPDLRGFLPYGNLYPYVGNVLTPWGAFEFNNTVVAGDRPLLLGEGGRLLLTLAGCVGGAALLDRLVRSVRCAVRPGLLAAFTAAHVLILLVAPTLFDRYLIVLVPGALALATTPAALPRWKAGLAGLVLFGGLCLGLMHDWLAWNASRWEVGRRALDRGIDPLDVEGGFEWDGWYSPRGAARARLPGAPQGLTLPFNGKLFPHLSGNFALSFSIPDGVEAVDSEPFVLWLLPGRREFFLVRPRVPAPP